MSKESFNAKMREFIGVSPPPNFNSWAARADQLFLRLPFGKWINIYDYEYPECFLYILACWEEEFTIEYDAHKLKFKKVCKLTATNSINSNN